MNPVFPAHDVTSAERASLDYALAVTRAAKSSFPLAFWVLPRPKREAMNVLYAFFRLTDDLADKPGEVDAKRLALKRWRGQLEAALAGTFTHPLHPALARVVQQYQVPTVHLQEVIDGVECDLEPVRFGSFFELYRYCYRVASAVGLSCLPVWGFRSGVTIDDAREPAEAAGIAFQLTNILRDLAEDWAGGRVYLPQDELQRFEVSPSTWHESSEREKVAALLQFQLNRAWGYYSQSEPLAGLLTPEGRAIFATMSRLYRGLLHRIESRGVNLFRERVRLGRTAKLGILLRAWPIKWGWL